MVMVFLAVVFAKVPVELTSLYFSFVQALFAIATYFKDEEDNNMTNGFLVVSGTHGVVRILVG